MYLPIKIEETKGSGLTESAVIRVELRVGDQIRLHEPSPSLGLEFRPFEVVGFEDGGNGRRALLRSPDGDLFHMEIGDTIDVWRSGDDESPA